MSKNYNNDIDMGIANVNQQVSTTEISTKQKVTQGNVVAPIRQAVVKTSPTKVKESTKSK